MLENYLFNDRAPDINYRHLLYTCEAGQARVRIERSERAKCAQRVSGQEGAVKKKRRRGTPLVRAFVQN